MSQVNLRIGYRPARIGWCIMPGDKDALSEALRLSTTMLGGKFNPVIVVDDTDNPHQLIDAFRVDALAPLTADNEIRQFIDSYKNRLPWPFFWREVFFDSDRNPTVLDISHAISWFEQHQQSQKLKGRFRTPVRPVWQKDDPLANIFACTFGSLPASGELNAPNYEALFDKVLQPDVLDLTEAGALSVELASAYTPLTVSSINLKFDSRYDFDRPFNSGVFVGHADNLSDIIKFWNLRAAGQDLFFFDGNHEDRLREFCLQNLPIRESTDDFFKNPSAIFESDSIEAAEVDVLCTPERQAVRLGSGSKLIAQRVVFFDEETLLANTEPENNHRITIRLPQSPFLPERRYSSQHLFVTVFPVGDLDFSTDRTLRIPNFSELNEFVARKTSGVYWNKFRLQNHGIDILHKVGDDLLHLTPIEKRELVSKTLEVLGIVAKPSKPGLIATRLIRQMGGIQGCRIFKIAGVRRLIKKYGPHQSFVRSQAIHLIGNQDCSNKMHFENYEKLFIGQGRKKLTPEFAFDELVDKGVFRVGMELHCPNCELKFWLSLDDVQTLVHCDYCGEKFKITRQLKASSWSFRPSGLFSTGENQQGAIPVVVTMQQFDTAMRRPTGWTIIETAMELSPKSRQFKKCESDLILISMDRRNRLNVLVGECKGNDSITEEDVEKLTGLADSLPTDRVAAYIFFAKLNAFSKDEIEICRKAQSNCPHLRVIMLTDTELEPYEMYDEYDEFGIGSPNDLDEMAAATSIIFFRDYLHMKALYRMHNDYFRWHPKPVEPSQAFDQTHEQPSSFDI